MLRLPLALVLLLCAQLVQGAKLRQETVQAFDKYDQQVARRVQTDLDAGHLITGLTSEQISQLKRGEVVMMPMAGVPDISGGLLHDWVGAVFIPKATLTSTLALLEDYNNHKVTYKSEVTDSKLLSHTGNEFRAFMRFYKKKILAVTLDTEHVARYVSLSPTRAYSFSRSTKIAEVDDAGTRSEHEKPQGDDDGFLWRLNSYWRMEEKDGGTYVQCEAVSLTRDIPAGLGWLIKPFVTDVPRESLHNTLESTRRALTSGK